MTITGKAVANPSNFLVRMGTPISCLIEAAGGLPENTGKIIGGGPMMGKALISAEVPVCKGSSGVLLLTKEESVRKADPGLHPLRQMRRCLPDGIEPYPIDERHGIPELGIGGEELYHRLYRVRVV